MRLLKSLILVFILFQACKEKELLGEDPYAGGKEALGMKFKNSNPVPNSGNPGDIVLFKATGLEKYRGDIVFYINEEKANIINMTDTTIQVQVPENVSTGGASMIVNGEVVFGPRFVINGKVGINNSFNVSTGFQYQFSPASGVRSKGVVFNFLNTNANTVYVGLFADYNTSATTASPINGIVKLSNTGAVVTGTPSFGTALSNGGYLSTAIELADGKFIVSGLFNQFQKNKLTNNITRLMPTGVLDTSTIRVLNDTEDPKKSIDTIPNFNGGVDGTIHKSFLVKHNGQEKIISVGNFKNYMKIRYDYRPTYDYKRIDYVKIEQIVRMDKDGELDKGYNYDVSTSKGLTPSNGFLNDAAVEDNGKLIVVGRFTRLQNKTTNNIARLDENGLVDESFNVGSGANGEITSIQRSQGKILLTGLFTKFNNQDVNGVVMLNLDGSIDNSFKFKETIGGRATFAKLLSNDKVLVAGTFEKYDNVKRSGLLVLEKSGEALQAFNNIGSFEGVIYNVKEVTLASKFTAILMGNIRRFDNKEVAGIVAVEIKN